MLNIIMTLSSDPPPLISHLELVLLKFCSKMKQLIPTIVQHHSLNPPPTHLLNITMTTISDVKRTKFSLEMPPYSVEVLRLLEFYRLLVQGLRLDY